MAEEIEAAQLEADRCSLKQFNVGGGERGRRGGVSSGGWGGPMLMVPGLRCGD